MTCHDMSSDEPSLMLFDVRTWRGGGMRAGSVGEEAGEVVCRVHNGVTVEEHRWEAGLDSEPLDSRVEL